MQLIGMLDSPYVRRVAISFQLMGVPFTHRPVSVFRHLDTFQAINPVVKAPTLVCDDGLVLMDSSLILQFAEGLPGLRRTLLPAGPVARGQAFRVIGLALAAAEKSIQIYYEHALRPEDKRHDPWLSRVTGQLAAACTALEAEVQRHPPAAQADTVDQAGLTAAVAWNFITRMTPDALVVADHPGLAALTEALEATPAFRAAPFGDGTYPVAD